MFTKKHRMVLLSLLVFGLLGAAQSAFGQVVFGVSAAKAKVRFEGTKEAVGQVVLTAQSAGTIKGPGGGNPGSIIQVDYGTTITNAASVTAANNVVCSNTAATCPANITAAAAGTVLTLTFTADTAFADSNTIVFKGVRVNANALGSPAGIVADLANVSAAVAAAFVGTYPISFTGNTQVNVADIYPKALTVGLATAPAPSILTCLPPTGDPDTAATLFSISVVENFNSALTTIADETGLAPMPAPTNGSNLLVTFTGVPIGVTIESEGCTSLGGAFTCGGPEIFEVAKTAATANATLTFFVQVATDNTLFIDSGTLNFEVYSSTASLPTGNVPSSITATVSLTSTIAPAAADVPFFVPNVQGAGPFVVANISDCVTYLLWPWVTAFNVPGLAHAGAHFDTGLAISNTSLDPFGPAGALPATFTGLAQTGSCSLVMFANDGTVAAPVATAPIPAGGATIVDAATTWPGKSGYVFARCGFQNAHSFEYITDNYPNDPNTAVSVLGLVLPNPNLVPRNPAGGGAGEALVH